MIRKIKSIDELYEETKSFDLVITNDAPLNTALNKKINTSYLGLFAQTARLIGSKYSNYLFEEEQLKISQIVLKIKNKFNLNLKESLFYTKNIFYIWEKTGSLDITEKYLTTLEKEILEYIKILPTYQISMEKMNLSFLNKNNIAVIGEELFTNLDKQVLNQKYFSINIFKNQTHNLEPFYIFDSKKDIISSLTEVINKDNQNNIAIVLDIESEFLPLIKARLSNKKIDINEKIFLYQEFNTRLFFSILDICFSLNNIYTKEVLPLANLFSINVDSSFENTFFFELVKKNSSAKKLFTFLEKIKINTYGYLYEKLQEIEIDLPKQLKEILHNLDLYDEKIDLDKTLDLKFYIENFQEELQTNKKGVLLVDSKNSIFINREIIFYIGINDSWMKNIEKTSYINSKLEFDKNLKKFEILIQQGSERFFLVEKNAKPPVYFNFLFDCIIESYTQECFNHQEFKSKLIDKKVVFSKKTTKTNYSLDFISSSSLNTFSQCPKKYSYSKLISGSQQDFFLKGQLLHQFAEFYLNYKDFVLEKTLDEFVNIILNELKAFTNSLKIKVLSTDIKIACIFIIDFIDSLKINFEFELKEERKNKISKKEQINIFCNFFNLKFKYNNAELEFKDVDLNLKGIIDLVVNDTIIVDYKTGKKKLPLEIKKNANFKEISSSCDFQPLVYLTFFRKLNPDKKLIFFYNFPMINSYEKLLNKKINENTIKVSYLPILFSEFLISSDFKNKFMVLLGKETLSIFENFQSNLFFKTVPDLDSNLNKNIFLNKYEDDFYKYHIKKGLKESDKNRELVSKLLKYIINFKYNEKIGNTSQKEVIFYKNDLDEFEDFIKKSKEKINKYYQESFPYEPIEGLKTCDICEFNKICLKKGVK